MGRNGRCLLLGVWVFAERKSPQEKHSCFVVEVVWASDQDTSAVVFLTCQTGGQLDQEHAGGIYTLPGACSWVEGCLCCLTYIYSFGTVLFHLCTRCVLESF